MSQNGGKPNPETDDSAQAFLEYFRCPPEFAPFELTAKPSGTEAFFVYESIRCYGKTANGTDQGSARSFAAAGASNNSNGKVHLSFSPTEIIENFRRERYQATPKSERVFHELYYSVRPMLSFRMRRLLQQAVTRRRDWSFPRWPVDCSVEEIFESLMKSSLRATGASEIPFIWFWPDGKNCALMMTHDVEEAAGVRNCDTLMDLDDAAGIRSAFQVIPEGRYQDVASLIAHIRERGFETNVHDLDHDGRLYDNIEEFRQRAQKINEYARKYGMDGFRAGAMHRNQEWFGMLNFQYEMSVPNVTHLEPQTGGCCTVSPYFVGDVLELPLTTAQDHGLFHILGETSIDLWKQQIEIISAHHGLISFIVHPDYTVEDEKRELYRELLGYLSDRKTDCGIWFAAPGEINRWWRDRNQMRLARGQGGWQVLGPGSERARIGYARIVDGKLNYRVTDQGSPFSTSAKN